MFQKHTSVPKIQVARVKLQERQITAEYRTYPIRYKILYSNSVYEIVFYQIIPHLFDIQFYRFSIRVYIYDVNKNSSIDPRGS